MGFPWALAIALTVLAFAYIIKYFVEKTVEEQNPFFMIIGVFLIVYVVAAFGVSYFNPVELSPIDINQIVYSQSLAP
ncbi:hypothetical protein KBC54_03195 [Patescibacteria group bacterium]|nr:hypothetical protein [Patescibacteria group bacterium]